MFTKETVMQIEIGEENSRENVGGYFSIEL